MPAKDRLNVIPLNVIEKKLETSLLRKGHGYILKQIKQGFSGPQLHFQKIFKLKPFKVRQKHGTSETHYYNFELALYSLPYPIVGISSSLTKSERTKWCFEIRKRLITDSLTWKKKEK